MGRVSYGAYVLHDIPHTLYWKLATKLAMRADTFHHVAPHTYDLQVRMLTAAISLPTTFLLAWFSFRFFESFFLDLKERWTVRAGGAER